MTTVSKEKDELWADLKIFVKDLKAFKPKAILGLFLLIAVIYFMYGVQIFPVLMEYTLAFLLLMGLSVVLYVFWPRKGEVIVEERRDSGG